MSLIILIRFVIKANNQNVAPNLPNCLGSPCIILSFAKIFKLSNIQYTPKKPLINTDKAILKLIYGFFFNISYIFLYSFTLLNSLNNFLASLMATITK